MTILKPWALGPFELIGHAEEHADGGSDFDRRIALISFDNAIELSIITYLSLNPIQRGGRQFPQADVERWLRNFHTKLEFLEHFVISILSRAMEFERDEIIFYHQLRNELYHSGNGMVPAVAHISGIRGAALWVFSTLFNVEAESLLTERAASSIKHPVEEENADLSDQTQFLELFISMRHDLNMLMRIAGANESRGTTQIPATEAWKNVFSSDVGEASERYEQVLKQAEILRDQIIEGKTSDSSDAKLRSLSHDLAEVSDFINAELRSHQREIVEKAIEATSRAASPQGNRLAGIIWQTQGSGITLSAISYVTQALSIKELHSPTIIFAPDMNVIVDQSYQRLITSAKSFSPWAVRVSKTSELLNVLRSNEKKLYSPPYNVY